MLDTLSGLDASKSLTIDGSSGNFTDTDVVPLCVDLDGTLVKTDVLVEGLVAIFADRKALSRLPILLTGDRAKLKRRVANLSKLDVALLPYNENLLAYLREQRAAGRRLVLATAADATVAHAVADHVGLFDLVVCSDGVHNLKGEAKALALSERFGKAGFDYAGGDHADLPIWRVARRAIVVNASSRVRDRLPAHTPVEVEFNDRAPLLRSALKATRPHQWSKNLLVFVPMIMAHAVTDLNAWFHAICMFLSFCATASCIYLVNDIADLAADRQHPLKRYRPLASGRLGLLAGLILAGVLGTAGIGLAALIGAAIIMVIYAAISISYSVVLKEFPIVDVFVLAALYTIRLLSGGIATDYKVSLWLLAFSGFLFLALALVKRTGEIRSMVHTATRMVRRGYFPGDIVILQAFGCASSFASGIVLALFVGSDAASLRYVSPELLWGVVPLIVFWQCRLWLAMARGHMHSDPIVYAMRDWVSWMVIGCIVFLAAAATIGVPPSIAGIVSR